LLEIIAALHTPGCFPSLLHRWQQQGNENTDDCNDDQQFHKREAQPFMHGTFFLALKIHKRLYCKDAPKESVDMNRSMAGARLRRRANRMPRFVYLENVCIPSLSFHLLANKWLPADIFSLLLIGEKCRHVVPTGTEHRVGCGDVIALAVVLLSAPRRFKKRPSC
jgi:hypothetical protein